MIDVNLRTTLLAFAALGLVAGGLTAPLASADHEYPDTSKWACYQVYFFVWDLGPVTVDASDSCWSVVANHSDECDSGTAQLVLDADCRQDLIEQTCGNAEVGPWQVTCNLETDFCEKFRCDCFCDPPHSFPAAE